MKDEEIGEGLIRIGAMTRGQVEDVLRRRRGGDNRLFGEIALDLGLVDDEAIQPSPRQRTVAEERWPTAREVSCAGVHHVVHVSTDIKRNCEFCSEPIGGDRFAESINHYISDHGYRLVHVGTETVDTGEGLWYSTVAVLGK